MTCDPVLASALRRSAGKLEERSDAGRLRALALLGAGALDREDAGDERRRVDDQIAQLVASGRLTPAIRGLPPVAGHPNADTPGSDALEWVRGDR